MSTTPASEVVVGQRIRLPGWPINGREVVAVDGELSGATNDAPALVRLRVEGMAATDSVMLPPGRPVTIVE